MVASTREASTAAAAQAVREDSGEGKGKSVARLARQGGIHHVQIVLSYKHLSVTCPAPLSRVVALRNEAATPLLSGSAPHLAVGGCFPPVGGTPRHLSLIPTGSRNHPRCPY